MKKLSFLTGKWSGEASVLRAPGQFASLSQTEEAQFKLGGLVLMIEGVGRTKPDNALALQALGLISFDDQAGTYRMRAFNDGRWLETEVKLVGENSLTWGFQVGRVQNQLHTSHERKRRVDRATPALVAVKGLNVGAVCDKLAHCVPLAST